LLAKISLYLNNLCSTRTWCYTETVPCDLKFNLTHNDEPIQLKTSRNTQLYRSKLKFLLQQTLYSIVKYLSYEVLRWECNCT